MIILKASTKAGQNIIGRCSHKQGDTLSDVYGKYSSQKVIAYNWCKEQYEQTENHNNFRITAASCTQFSVAWNGTKDGEPILRHETKDNSYIVLLGK